MPVGEEYERAIARIMASHLAQVLEELRADTQSQLGFINAPTNSNWPVLPSWIT